MTARIVVVADNRSLSLALTGQDFDVVDLHPDELSGWVDQGGSPDVMLVNVDSPAEAVEIVGTCQQKHSGVPVLLVASSEPGWSSVSQLDGAEVEILTLPVSRLSLVNAVHRAVNVNGTSAPPAAEAPSAPEPAPVPSIRDGVAAAATTTEPAADLRGAHDRIVAARSTAGLRERLAHRPAAAAEALSSTAVEPEPVDVVPVQHESPTPPGATTHRTTPREQSAEWSQLRDGATADADPVVRHRPQTAHEMVRLLLAHVSDLVDVRDAASALVEEAALLAAATYGAVLLPDDGVWRVSGAKGVRPLEWRYVVEADSWLATTVIEAKRGVIVEDSDIARQRLGGAPLAHHQHLLAAPVPDAEGLLILARETEAFDEAQLSAVASACAGAGSLLAEALHVRALARALGDFRDLDD